MDQNDFRPKPSTIGRLLIIGVGIVSGASFGQTPPAPGTAVDLSSPALKANASILQNDLPGPSIPGDLARGRAAAASNGRPWKGLNMITFDDQPAPPPGESLTSALLRLYPRQACQADAIVVGHTISSAFHLSASGSRVYGDYIFAIDSLLKDNQASSIRSQPDIVVTRPGGSLSLPDGPINFEMRAFPRLQSGAAYILFLRYIPQSSSYQALDPFSTLVADGSNWVDARKAFSSLALPGFTRGPLEATIGNWLASCK